jgi:hypothetical protein
MLNTLRTAVSAVLLLLTPAAVIAQAPGSNDPDYKEVVAYRLTVATMNKVMQAQRNIADAMKEDPRFIKVEGLKAEIEKLREKDDMTEADEARLEKLEEEMNQAQGIDSSNDNSARTLSQMAAAINDVPAARAALAGAGLDAREYTKFSLAAMQAGTIAGMMKSGVVKEVPKELAATVNMENVKFMQEHEAEVEAFAKLMAGKEQ